MYLILHSSTTRNEIYEFYDGKIGRGPKNHVLHLRSSRKFFRHF